MKSNSSQSKLSFVIPVPLPTTNRVLAMSPWQRKKLRDLTDQLVSLMLSIDSCSQTQTDLGPSMSQMRSLVQAYFEMIRPRKSQGDRVTGNLEYTEIHIEEVEAGNEV